MSIPFSSIKTEFLEYLLSLKDKKNTPTLRASIVESLTTLFNTGFFLVSMEDYVPDYFHVVCDDSNNPPDVLDKEAIVFDLYLQDKFSAFPDRINVVLSEFLCRDIERYLELR